MPKNMGGVSIQVKILEIQDKSMAETMFSMILPFQHFRELALKYYDIRLNLGKSSLSRNPIRADKETHAIGGSKNLSDRFLFTYDGLLRVPTLPACLTKIISDAMNDSWEERFLIVRDSCRTFGLDLRAFYEKQNLSAINAQSCDKPVGNISRTNFRDESDEESGENYYQVIYR